MGGKAAVASAPMSTSASVLRRKYDQMMAAANQGLSSSPNWQNAINAHTGTTSGGIVSGGPGTVTMPHYPSNGQLYYDSQSGKTYVHHNGSWVVTGEAINKTPNAAMIHMRLRMDAHELRSKGVEIRDVYDNGSAVFIAVVTKATMIILEDEEAMFPSDSLVTRLRILL